MSKRFGKKRVWNCECTYNFTCHPCLDDSIQEGLPQGKKPADPDNRKETNENKISSNPRES